MQPKKKSVDLRTVRQSIQNDLVGQRIESLVSQIKAMKYEMQCLKEEVQEVKRSYGKVDTVPYTSTEEEKDPKKKQISTL